MNKKVTNSTVFQLMEQWAPKSLAYDWDNVGLQVGNFSNQVNRVMISLDVLEPTVDEAIDKNVDLIIAHHPLLFSPLNQVNTDTPKGRIISKLIKHNISVYAAHTNLDIASGGVNDILSEALNIQSSQPLVHFKTENLYKIAVFVPLTHISEVREALSVSGAGHIGNYSHCTFQTEGQGTFKPLEETNPFIGTQHKLEYVNEVKIESIVEESKLSAIIQAMKKSHPYEVVAYDVYPLENKGKGHGLGRIGNLTKTVSLQTFSEYVKNAFNLQHLRVTGNLSKKIKRVAVLGGSGEKFINDAKKMGADAYVTGDMTFHHAQDAWQIGLAVIDAGHYIEEVMKKTTKQFLKENINDNEVDVIISTTNTNPFQFV